jgi:hypothetical protein
MYYETFIKWLIPFLCGGIASLFGIIVSRAKLGKKKQNALAVGLQCLLRAEIIRQYEKWNEKQYCPIYAKEALKRVFDSYHTLGGNDVATGLYDETMALPEKPP